MPVVSQIPGDLSVVMIAGDELNFTIDLDVDVTSYTFTAGVYVVSTNGFFGGNGGTVNAVGATAITPTVTISNASAGIVLWGANESQTASLSPAIKYRHWVRWQTPQGVTRTIVSGDFTVKAP